MTVEEIRDIASRHMQVAQSVNNDAGLRALELSTPCASLVIQAEIAAQLVELNQNLKALFGPRAQVVGPDFFDKLAVNAGQVTPGAAELEKFAAGLLPMGPDGK